MSDEPLSMGGNPTGEEDGSDEWSDESQDEDPDGEVCDFFCLAFCLVSQLFASVVLFSSFLFFPFLSFLSFLFSSFSFDTCSNHSLLWQLWNLAEPLWGENCVNKLGIGCKNRKRLRGANFGRERDVKREFAVGVFTKCNRV